MTQYTAYIGFACILFIHSFGCGAPYSPPGPLDVSYPRGEKSFQFIVCGDNRPNPGREGLNAIVQRNFAKEVIRMQPRFVINTGDLVWAGISKKGWRKFESQTLSPIRAKEIPYYPAIGNHELNYGPFGLPAWWEFRWRGILMLPLLPIEGLSRLGFPGIPNKTQAIDNFFKHFPELRRREAYAFQYGNSHFVFLNTESPTSTDSTQGEFLRAQFENVKADVSYRFFFVVFHRPAYTIGARHSPRPRERQLAKILESYQQRCIQDKRNLQIIALMGHNHIYYRTRRNGVIYILTGGGGAPLYNVQPDQGTIPGDKWGIGYHYVLVTINRSEIAIKPTLIPTLEEGRN